MAHYRVRVRRGDFEVEVDSADKDYVESKLKELLAGSDGRQPEARGTVAGSGAEPAAPAATGKTLSLPEYVRRLSPKSGPQYVVSVGSYLETYGGMGSGFKSRDIVDGFTTVKYKHSNPAEAVRQAKQQGLLMDGKEAGTLQVTSTGEDWVKVQLGAE